MFSETKKKQMRKQLQGNGVRPKITVKLFEKKVLPFFRVIKNQFYKCKSSLDTLKSLSPKDHKYVYPPPKKKKKKWQLFFLGGGINLFVWEEFNFELGNFYLGEGHFGTSWVWSPAGWSIALIRPALLGHEF